MYKKIFATMTLLFAFTLLGCGQSANNKPAETAAETKVEAPANQEADTASEPVAEPTEEVAETSEDENTEGETIITISWDTASVEYTGDPYEYNEATDGNVAPHIYAEGDDVEILEEATKGTIVTTKIAIKSSDKYASVIVEPNAPTNFCPLDTVTATITYPDGKEETLSQDKCLTRGQTGIWYFDVYKQGTDQ